MFSVTGKLLVKPRVRGAPCFLYRVDVLHLRPSHKMNPRLCCAQLAEGQTLGRRRALCPIIWRWSEREELEGIGQSFWAWGGKAELDQDWGCRGLLGSESL